MIWLIVGIVVAVGIFLIFAPFFPVFQSKGDPSEIIEKQGTGDGRKVLVAYYTRHGSTATIAEKISDTLAAKGYLTDVCFINNLTRDDLDKYDAFVIGSGVIWSKLTPEFQDFLKEHEAVWQEKPTALFGVCLTIQRETDANRERVKNYLADSIKHVPSFDPFERVAFAGRVDMEKLSFFERFVLNIFFLITPQRGGDHRDMNKVAGWAQTVATELASRLE